MNVLVEYLRRRNVRRSRSASIQVSQYVLVGWRNVPKLMCASAFLEGAAQLITAGLGSCHIGCSLLLRWATGAACITLIHCTAGVGLFEHEISPVNTATRERLSLSFQAICGYFSVSEWLEWGASMRAYFGLLNCNQSSQWLGVPYAPQTPSVFAWLRRYNYIL